MKTVIIIGLIFACQFPVFAQSAQPTWPSTKPGAPKHTNGAGSR